MPDKFRLGDTVRVPLPAQFHVRRVDFILLNARGEECDENGDALHTIKYRTEILDTPEKVNRFNLMGPANMSEVVNAAKS